MFLATIGANTRHHQKKNLQVEIFVKPLWQTTSLPSVFSHTRQRSSLLRVKQKTLDKEASLPSVRKYTRQRSIFADCFFVQRSFFAECFFTLAKCQTTNT
jgi:hypothetical protein